MLHIFPIFLQCICVLNGNIYIHIHRQQILFNRLTFVFKAEDSSSVYYTVNAGLLKPAAPELTKQLKEKEEKKFNLETEIRKNTSNLYELAKTLIDKNNDQSCSPATDTTVVSANIDSRLDIS